MRPLLGLAFILISTLTHAQGALAYHWMREIELPNLTATTLIAAPLDSHIYSHTREGRSDLRLRDEKGAAIGFVIRSANDRKARTVRSTWAADPSAAKVDASVGLQFELVLREKDLSPDGIRIVTPLRDFEHQVRVESSADGLTWTSAGSPTLIFDYSRYIDARNDLVAIKRTDDRRFRVTIQDITAEQQSQLLELHRHLRGGEETDRTERTTINRVPFRIDRVEFYRDDSKTESGDRRMTDYAAEDFKTTENEKDHQTILTFDTQREPVTRIKVITAAENFSRAAIVEDELEGPNGKTTWQHVSSGTLTKFAVGSIQKEELTLETREVGATHYRILIDNRDSPVLPITDVKLSGPLYELMFLASPGQKVELEYGSSNAPAGKYDTAAVEAALSHNQQIATATLKPPRENPNTPADRGHAWQPWNEPRIVVVVICAATLLLGWGLFQASRRITLPPEE